MSTSLSPNQQKRLSLLGVTAVVLALAAIFVRMQDYKDVTAAFTTRPLFPQLGEQVNEVTRVSIRSSQGAFDIVRADGGGWILPDKADYWADDGAVRQLLLALKDLKLVEAKTASAAYHEAIGLGAPEDGGSGLQISLFAGEADNPVADVLVGNRQYRSGSEDAFYVRVPGQDQTWLAQGRLELRPLATDWLDKAIVPFKRSDFETVSVTRVDGAPYQVARQASGEGFVLTPPPGAGKEVSDYDLHSVFYGLASLSVDDVKGLDGLLFDGHATPVAHADYSLKDGATIRADFLKTGNKYWVRFKATGGADGDADRKSQFDAFQKHIEKWGFELSSTKFAQMTRPYKELLLDKQKKPAPSLQELQDAPDINLGADEKLLNGLPQ